jgi:predicted aspartyl protease
MISGIVDDYGRALIPLVLAHPSTGGTITVEAWIDSAFTGYLLLTPDQASQLGLARSNTVTGRVATGSEVTFETASYVVAWFDRMQPTEAVISPGAFALVGIHLMSDCTVEIDYPARRVMLTLSTGNGQRAP